MATTRTTELRERMRQDLQLAGLSERTQDAYIRSVRQLADHLHTPPDRLTEAQLRAPPRILDRAPPAPPDRSPSASPGPPAPPATPRAFH
jgi:hypothetical protein